MSAKSFGTSLFYLLIAIQVAAAIIPIRNWPLTDYPMFGIAVSDFDSISRFSVEDLYDNTEIPWTRGDYQSVGLNDHRLQYYVNQTNYSRIHELLSEKVKHIARYQTKAPQSLRLYKLTYRPDTDGHLNKSRELLKEFPFEELRKQ